MKWKEFELDFLVMAIMHTKRDAYYPISITFDLMLIMLLDYHIYIYIYISVTRTPMMCGPGSKITQSQLPTDATGQFLIPISSESIRL